MSKHNLRFLRNEVIEQVTAQRIREYESKSCTAVTFPVPVEQIIEQVLGLDFDWDEIEEMPGEQILAGLDAMTDPRAAKLLKKLTEGHDTPDQKSAVDRYQSALLMPEWLMREAAANLDLTSWSVLYELANTAKVTISNLVVRLRRLDLIYMREWDKTIYRSRDDFTGQKTLL